MVAKKTFSGFQLMRSLLCNSRKGQQQHLSSSEEVCFFFNANIAEDYSAIPWVLQVLGAYARILNIPIQCDT